jgi:uncharacterized Zn-binding protein involved in type VI secretion
VVGKAGDAAATATKNAGAMQQEPSSHWYDVWTHTKDGLMDRAANGDVRYAVTHSFPLAGALDSQYQMLKSIGRLDWLPMSAEAWKARATGLVDGMSQQASAIEAQAGAVWNGTTPDGKEMSTLARAGAALGLLTSIEQLITMPLGMIPFPAMPAIRVGDMDVGIPHAHLHPPNYAPPAIPTPIPLPSTGPIVPIPYLSGASKTLINGMPAARCGDLGLGIWCGGYFPMYEVFLGSSNVWIEGSRAGRVGVDITKHCILSSPGPSDKPLGAMFGATINCSNNVMIGGIPMPSLTSMAIAQMFKVAFGLGKSLLAKVLKKERVRVPSDMPSTMGPSHPWLRGPTSGHFPPQMGPWADEIIQIMKPGDRLPIKSIHAGELAGMARVTGDEFGVVVGQDGKLYLIRGFDGGPGGKHVHPEPGDQLLVHAHPQPYHTRASAVSAGDVKGYTFDKDEFGWDHPQAVIDSEGNVHHFDENGVVGNPKMSPIAPDGTIDGIHRDPRGPGSGVAIPPGMGPKPGDMND